MANLSKIKRDQMIAFLESLKESHSDDASIQGSSNNIDKYAGKKFEALKEYCSRHPELHWGFVRAVGTQLYISNTVWTEDMTNEKVWKPIEKLL